jgi:molecular chaperone DnaJ
MPVNVTQAALGATLDVPTLDGETTRLSIPEGTQTGASFRIRNQGVPHLGSRGRGDLHVAVRVVTPTRLTSEQRKLIDQLGKTLPVPEISEKDRSILDRMKDILS